MHGYVLKLGTDIGTRVVRHARRNGLTHILPLLVITHQCPGHKYGIKLTETLLRNTLITFSLNISSIAVK